MLNRIYSDEQFDVYNIFLCRIKIDISVVIESFILYHVHIRTHVLRSIV